MLTKIYDGTGKAPPDHVLLRAGALTAHYEAGMLRYIKLGEHEILRGVYAAVRDHNWATILAQLRDVTIETGTDSFEIRFISDHEQGDIHFVWRGRISGSADSTIRFTFDGEALTSFRRNRVGFCVLHPMTLAGHSVEIDHTDSSIEQSKFPDAIAPHQPFFDVRAMTHEIMMGVRAEVRLTGDTFETEDQRNWSDASYKTYCTPLALPYPALIAAGTKVQQSVTVRLIDEPESVSESVSELTLTVGSTGRALPPLGLCFAADAAPLTPREIERLKALRLAHLRLDLPLDKLHGSALEDRLRQANVEARAIGCPLELAVTLGRDLDADLARLHAAAHAVQPVIARWLIYRASENTTSSATIEAARAALGSDGAPLGVGTDGYFTQLNRERPPVELLDWICYSLNPQVHAFDNRTLVENLLAQGVTVESAREFTGGRSIAVSPVTLKMRFNIDATETGTDTKSDVLPANVDVRQVSLFGAGWTLGSIRALAAADSITYFETTGWRGVIEREAGSPLPEQFPSTAGGVYPMYHVFADVGEFTGGEVLSVVSSDPLRFDGLAVRNGGALRILVANFTHERQRITVRGVGGRFVQKSLDDTTAEQAVGDPEAYRAAAGVDVEAGADGLQVELLPYAVVRLDQQI